MDANGLNIFRCGVCGCQSIQSSPVAQKPLSYFKDFQTKGSPDASTPFWLTSQQRNAHHSLGEAHQRVHTVYHASDCMYYLHASAVHAPTDKAAAMVDLCDECMGVLKRCQMPKYCVAAGYDFGCPSAALPSLSLAERKLIALNIGMAHLLKLNLGQPALKGQVIAFPHEGRHIVADQIRGCKLPRLDLGGSLTVAIVGSKQERRTFLADSGGKEVVLQRFNDIFSVCIGSVYRWLRFLVECNGFYRGMEVILLDERDPSLYGLELLGDRLLSQAIEIEDQVGKHQEEVMTQNIAQQQGDPLDGTAVMVQENIAHDENIALRSLANGLNIPINNPPSSSGTTETIIVVRGTTPINEFSENDRLWLGQFPDLFPLGKGMKSTGPLPMDLVRHMLLQADLRFARCDDFVFTAFNQMQRHAAARGASVRMKAGHPAAGRLMELLNRPDFDAQLQEAIANPKGQMARQLHSHINTSLQLVGAKVPWSSQQRRLLLSSMKGYVVAFGMPSFFVTWSPCDVDSVLLLRVTGHIEPHVLPMHLPPLPDRMHNLVRNSVSAARLFIRLTECVLEHLGV